MVTQQIFLGSNQKYRESMKNLALKNTLCFESQEDGNSISVAMASDAALEYSIDEGQAWADYANDAIILDTNERIYFRTQANKDYFSKNGQINQFYFNKPVKASGNIASLINRDTIFIDELPDYCFCQLFSQATAKTNLLTPPELPVAKKLGNSTFRECFKDCSNMQYAPELPDCELAENCYRGMFVNCSTISKAPKITASTFPKFCCAWMFQGCTGITETQGSMYMTSIDSAACLGMFYGCTSLTAMPKMYCGMNITYGPDTSEQGVFQSMMQNCTSLSSISIDLRSCTANDIGFTRAFVDSFRGCTALRDAVVKVGDGRISGNLCFNSTFRECSQLSSIEVNYKAWPTTTGGSSINPNANWVNGVAQAGVFKCPRELPAETGVNRIPTGWEVVRV